jgi:hypothetical protein
VDVLHAGEDSVTGGEGGKTTETGQTGDPPRSHQRQGSCAQSPAYDGEPRHASWRQVTPDDQTRHVRLPITHPGDELSSTNHLARVSAGASLPGRPDSLHLTVCLLWRQLVARQRDGLRARGTKKHGLGAQETATQEIQRLGQTANGARRNDGLADPGSQQRQPGTRRGGIVRCAF